ncbi:hypothetical protein DL93DRAFT_2226854 [Clavulina sp. PMI_390]|nr:hypothetical protein DL93DRAFT_2226854 [Clavulina sp. PMI_390]
MRGSNDVASEANNPSKSARSSAPLSNPVGFPGADIVLRSQDGVDFAVDSIFLSRASEFFRNIFSTLGVPEKPLLMEERAEILDTLLRLLYPVQIPPKPLTTKQASAFLRMVEKFGISSHVVDAFTDAFFSTCHPLQGWALSVRFRRATSRKSTALRYIMLDDHDSGESDGGILELDNVSARSFAQIRELRTEARSIVRFLWAGIPWTCKAHLHELWRSKRMEEINSQPFNDSKSSEEALEVIVQAMNCNDCLNYFNHTVSIRDLYPVEAPPPPLTADQAPEFIRMAEKFGIKTHLAESLINAYFATCHPFRGWALSVHYSRAANRKSSAKRYFMADDDEKVGGFPELDHISARLYAYLRELRAASRSSAQYVWADMASWACKKHVDAGWYYKRMREINETPFDESKTSEEALDLLIDAADCYGCSGRFNRTTSNRRHAREQVQKILDESIARA